MKEQNAGSVDHPKQSLAPVSFSDFVITHHVTCLTVTRTSADETIQGYEEAMDVQLVLR
jgi:hypothetical protein